MDKFMMIPRTLLEDESLKALDIVVYAALDTFANALGEAWPSLSAIAVRSRISTATVKRALSRLSCAGYVIREKRRRPDSRELDTTLYRLLFREGAVGSQGADRLVPPMRKVGSEEKGVGSGGSIGSVLSELEAGSERAGNYTHRTIPNERYCAGDISSAPISSPKLQGATDTETDATNCAMTQEKTLDSLFMEIWERYPRRQNRVEAKRAFTALFPPELPAVEIRRRLREISDRFAVFEEDAAKKVSRGEEHYIPCLHNWLAREGFADV